LTPSICASPPKCTRQRWLGLAGEAILLLIIAGGVVWAIVALVHAALLMASSTTLTDGANGQGDRRFDIVRNPQFGMRMVIGAREKTPRSIERHRD
jgi:hypothetical protein